MSQQESYDITISSVTGTKTIQFRLRRRLLMLIGALVAAVLLALLFGLISLGRLTHQAAQGRALRAENAEYRRQLVRLGELEDRIRLLDQARRDLLRVAGVELPAEEETESASGIDALAAASTTYRQAAPDSLTSESELTEIQDHIRRLPLEGPITRRFGRIRGAGIYHTGIDVAADTGADILAPGEGVVSFVGHDETFGQVLVVSHTAQLETMYGHASKILVRIGDSVALGQPIAEVGNTGRSSAPHLHFEVHWRGKAIDPAVVLERYRPVAESVETS